VILWLSVSRKFESRSCDIFGIYKQEVEVVILLDGIIGWHYVLAGSLVVEVVILLVSMY
jgi:hypothetical protein